MKKLCRYYDLKLFVFSTNRTNDQLAIDQVSHKKGDRVTIEYRLEGIEVESEGIER